MKWIGLVCALAAAPAFADPPRVESVRAEFDGAQWRFDVALRHADEGWEHYADGWDVRGPDGTEYGVRLLAHPHVEEQPFTRSLTGVVIPEAVTQVTIRARCSRDGWTSEPVTVALARD